VPCEWGRTDFVRPFFIPFIRPKGDKPFDVFLLFRRAYLNLLRGFYTGNAKEKITRWGFLAQNGRKFQC
jgi:hypothetical protein